MGKSVKDALNPFRGTSAKKMLDPRTAWDPREHTKMGTGSLRNTRDLLGYGDEGSFKGFDPDRFGGPKPPQRGPTSYNTPSRYSRPNPATSYARQGPPRAAPPPTQGINPGGGPRPGGMRMPRPQMRQPPQGRADPRQQMMQQQAQAQALRGGRR